MNIQQLRKAHTPLTPADLDRYAKLAENPDGYTRGTLEMAVRDLYCELARLTILTDNRDNQPPQ